MGQSDDLPGMPSSSISPPPPQMPAWGIPGQEHKTMPTIVIVTAIYLFLAALMEILGLFNSDGRSTVMMVIGIVDTTVFIIAKALMGIGLLKLKRWAFTGTIIVFIARFVLGNLWAGLEIFSPDFMKGNELPEQFARVILPIMYFGSMVIFGTIYTVFIILLAQPKVRKAFT